VTLVIREIRIDKIHPNYRLVCDEESILCLCDDIACCGLREPIIVELVEFRFRIIDGEKRWRACKKLGQKTIRAIIVETG